jgi:hypothetical protein
MSAVSGKAKAVSGSASATERRGQPRRHAIAVAEAPLRSLARREKTIAAAANFIAQPPWPLALQTCATHHMVDVSSITCSCNAPHVIRVQSHVHSGSINQLEATQ